VNRQSSIVNGGSFGAIEPFHAKAQRGHAKPQRHFLAPEGLKLGSNSHPLLDYCPGRGKTKGKSISCYFEYIPSLSRVCPEYIPSLYRSRNEPGIDSGRTGVDILYS